jgi:hypothetical protein
MVSVTEYSSDDVLGFATADAEDHFRDLVSG